MNFQKQEKGTKSFYLHLRFIVLVTTVGKMSLVAFGNGV